MSLEGLRPIELEQFRGLWTTQADQGKVPVGRSPLCQNVRFYPGGRVASREGMTTRATIAGTPEVLGIKEYVDNAMNRRLLVLTSDGTLQYESGAFTFTTIQTSVVQAGVAPFLRLSSTSLFNKEFICFGASSIFGSNPAKVFWYDSGSNTTFFDPIATEGPALAPTVAQSATAGNIALGPHLVRVFYRTRSGYWSQLGPAATYNCTVANKALDVSNIARGPSYVTERVVACTPATSTNYFFLEGTAMVIKDNSTNSATIDFTDATLTNGTPVSHLTVVSSDLTRQITIPANGAIGHYSGRLAYWGFRHQYLLNQDIGFRNMRFQGGWNAAGAPVSPGTGAGTTPNGWTQKIAGWTNSGAAVGSLTGDPARLTGTGAQVACYENNATWNQFIPSGVEVWVRMRAKRSATWGATESVHLYTSDTATAGATIAAANASFLPNSEFSSTEFAVVSKRMLTAAQNSGFATTRRLRFSSGNGVQGVAPLAGRTLDIDYIEVYTPGYDGDNQTSLIRWSKVNNPEAVDGLFGLMQVEPENGEPLTACFPMRGYWYMCKERSTFVTQDNGVSEPKDWTVQNVSTTIGTPSRFGVGMGDGWVAIAARSGLYMFAGGPIRVRLSDEIVPTWNRINFTNGIPGPAQKIWCLVDPDIKRIYVGVPLDGALDVSHVLVCDYSTGSDPSSADSRDWTIWTLAPRTAGFSIRADGTRMTLFGDASGRIASINSAATNDFSGTAIDAIYRTAFLGKGGGRERLGYLVVDITGAGTLILRTIGPDATTAKTWSTPANTLAAGPNKYAEWMLDHNGETIALEFRVNNSTHTFQVSYATAFMGDASPSGKVRSHAS